MANIVIYGHFDGHCDALGAHEFAILMHRVSAHIIYLSNVRRKQPALESCDKDQHKMLGCNHD